MFGQGLAQGTMQVNENQLFVQFENFRVAIAIIHEWPRVRAYIML